MQLTHRVHKADPHLASCVPAGPGRISAVKVQTDLDCAEWSTLAFVAYLISTDSHRALSGQIALEVEPWSTLEAGEPS